jgi:hypothetical protein
MTTRSSVRAFSVLWRRVEQQIDRAWLRHAHHGVDRVARSFHASGAQRVREARIHRVVIMHGGAGDVEHDEANHRSRSSWDRTSDVSSAR